MFFNRLIRNIVLFLIPFLIVVNIYFWSTAMSTGGEYTYVGFYAFFKNFERMPKFEYFVESMIELWEIVQDWNGLTIVLNVLTAGLPFIIKLSVGLTKALVCILIDLFRIFFWLMGFLGLDVEHGGIVTPQ